jgi:hypothetical protein
MHGTGLKVNESFWEKIHLIFLSLLPCHVVLRAYAAVFPSRISLLSSRWGLIKKPDQFTGNLHTQLHMLT